jgi:hypothetical protein
MFLLNIVSSTIHRVILLNYFATHRAGIIGPFVYLFAPVSGCSVP